MRDAGHLGEGASEGAAPSANQVEDQDHQGYNEQEVYQAARDVETKAEKPKDQNYNKDCPEHVYLSGCGERPSVEWRDAREFRLTI
jgi:hypothetical protein